MALLSSLLGGGGMSNPFAEYKQMQANPFTRMIPGSEYLGGAPSLPGLLQSQGGMDQGDASTIPTDFAGVPPGLPNLPQNLQGFGFGENAPQMNVNSNLRQGLIQQLLEQLSPQLGGAGQPFNGGFMGNMGQNDGMRNLRSILQNSSLMGGM